MGKRDVKNLGKKAVSYPLEFTVVASVIMISFALLFTAIGQMYTPYQVENVDLKSKAMVISERLIKDVGKCRDGSSDWEYHPSDLTYIGLASYKVYFDSWFSESLSVGSENITGYPYLKFDPTNAYAEMYPGDSTSFNFYIWNEGNGTLDFNLYFNSGGLISSVNPISGSSEGSQDRVTITVSISVPSTATPGSTLTDRIFIYSNSYPQPEDITFDITVYVKQPPIDTVGARCSITVSGDTCDICSTSDCPLTFDCPTSGTCSPTCSGSTCSSTCSGTTCSSTCSGTTCSSTCGSTCSQTSNYCTCGDGCYPPPCFLAGTKIALADGSTKNIEDVKVGDMVLSWNNGSIEPNKVIETFHHGAEYTKYYIVINNGLLKITSNHPVYSGGRWISAGELRVGYTLLDINGKEIKVRSIEKVYREVETFNLEVANSHTYFANGILVHNKVTTCIQAPYPNTCKPPGETGCTYAVGAGPSKEDINEASDGLLPVIERVSFETPLFKRSVGEVDVKPIENLDVGKKINKMSFASGETTSVGDNNVMVYQSYGTSVYGDASIDVQKEFYPTLPLVLYRYIERSGNSSQVVRIMLVLSDTADYGVLNPEKIKSMIYVPYERFKESLGVGTGYEVAVRIVNNEGRELLFYGKNYQDANILVSYSRAVMIYPDFMNNIREYQRATLTVYIFK